MKTILMNTENSETNERHRLRLTLANKLNLKDPSKNMALANLSIYSIWKNIKSAYNSNILKFLLQLGMINLIYLMDHILLLIHKIIFILSSRKMKL